jgi:anti-sigma B factor antagonist
VDFFGDDSMPTQDEKNLNPTPFELAGEEREGVQILIVTGELDLNTAPRLEERLGDGSEGGILIDLSGCEFIDSTGIGLIVRTWQRLEPADGEGISRFALCGLSDQVQRLLEITGLRSSISTYLSRDEAVAELRRD